MNKKLIYIILLLYSVVAFAQEEAYQDILKADSTWFKEIIEFPLSFARDINYEGFADLRFAPGFTKAESQELWSYVWAWNLINVKNISANQLEHDIELYFNGLLDLDPKYHKDAKQQTTAIFIKKETLDGSTKYIGKVKTYDTRYTKKPLTLNVQVENTYCKNENRTLLVFRYSPQNFKNEVWKKLKQVQLKNSICN